MAYRCRGCGLCYFVISYSADPLGRLIPIGADGEETAMEDLQRGCPEDGDKEETE